MLMTAIGRDLGASFYGELAGVRTLITGLSPECGVDVARAFADHKARLVLHMGESSPEMDALVPLLNETAYDIKLFADTCEDSDEVVRFAQKAVQAFGSLDVVINLIPVTAADLKDRVSIADVEDMVSEKLTLPLLTTRVVANRMRLTLTEGLVLNVMTTPTPHTAGEAALAGVIRATLATITRREAETWAGSGIRVNAIGPRAATSEGGASLASEPDIASLALYLASKRGKSLTGYVFDSDGVDAGWR
jgi:3-oxoacyl-[acyl-carrier protein] reductase